MPRHEGELAKPRDFCSCCGGSAKNTISAVSLKYGCIFQMFGKPEFLPMSSFFIVYTGKEMVCAEVWLWGSWEEWLLNHVCSFPTLLGPGLFPLGCLDWSQVPKCIILDFVAPLIVNVLVSNQVANKSRWQAPGGGQSSTGHRGDKSAAGNGDKKHIPLIAQTKEQTQPLLSYKVGILPSDLLCWKLL